jgi:hypothetical protein
MAETPKEEKAKEVLNKEQQKEELHRLEKLTITKLREEAKANHPELTGVSGMKKDDLIHEICRIKGIDCEERKKKIKTGAKAKIKKELKKLRVKKEEFQSKEFRKQRNILRKKIKKTKRMIRKVA